MKRYIAIIATIAGTALIMGACTSSSGATTTTTSLEPVTTTSPPETSTSTTAGVAQTTTTTVSRLTPPEYEIGSRTELDEGGEELVVLLDPTSYQSLTDLDLYDIIAEVVGENPTTSILHVVDSPDAADAVVDPDAEGSDPDSLEEHYLARLEGDQITYLGPFASSGGTTLGS